MVCQRLNPGCRCVTTLFHTGHYGIVRLATDKITRQKYAIKTIRKAKVSKYDALKKEIDILQACDHPNIIKLIEVHEDEKSIHLVQVMNSSKLYATLLMDDIFTLSIQ